MLEREKGRHLCASGGGQEPAEFEALRDFFGGALWFHVMMELAAISIAGIDGFSRKERPDCKD